MFRVVVFQHRVTWASTRISDPCTQVTGLRRPHACLDEDGTTIVLPQSSITSQTSVLQPQAAPSSSLPFLFTQPPPLVVPTAIAGWIRAPLAQLRAAPTLVNAMPATSDCDGKLPTGPSTAQVRLASLAPKHNCRIVPSRAPIKISPLTPPHRQVPASRPPEAKSWPGTQMSPTAHFTQDDLSMIAATMVTIPEMVRCLLV